MRKHIFIILFFLVLPTCFLSAEELTDIVSAPDVRPGLLVIVGAENADHLEKLYCSGKFLVHGLVNDRAVLRNLRKNLLEKKVYGNISVETSDLKTLPYADNTVNVLIINDNSKLNAGEMMRVLAPYGTLLQKDGNSYKRTDKPYPEGMDVWRQYAHDPASTYMSRDTIAGPNESIRWIAGDKYYSGRYVSPNVVSAGGRVFFNYHDRGYNGCLEARDAFNGRFLWKKSRTEGVRDFVADDDRLYIFHDGKLKALDAATGKYLYDFQLPGRVVWHILHLDKKSGILVFASKGENWAAGFDASTGKRLWQTDGFYRSWNIGNGVIGDGVFYFISPDGLEKRVGPANKCFIKAVDIKTGELKKEIRDVYREKDVNPTVAMFLDGKLIVSADNPEIKTRNGKRAYIVSVDTGKVLWSAETNGGIIRGGGFFLENGLFYAPKGNGLAGYDPDTGKIKDELMPTKTWKWHVNHGCDAMVATVNYFIGARMHFIDPVKKEVLHYTVTRTPCKDSVRVANGLVYFPRHTCACTDGMIGNIAISAKSALPESFDSEAYTPELIKGPGFSKALNPEHRTLNPVPDWPTYRANSYRGAYTGTGISSNLNVVWSVQPGTSATAPVIADGKVYVASSEEYTLFALNTDTGEKAWAYAAGGPIDSPPTIYNGLALFGSRDGWVYCVTSEKGELVWKFRGAPSEKKIIIQEQLESIWPVFGGVLIEDGIGYASAGRHADIDSGIFIYAFKPETGEIVWKRNVRNKNHNTEHAISSRLQGAGAVNDILRSDGANLYMAGDFEKRAFDLKTGEPVRPVKRELSQMQKALSEGKNGIVFEPDAGDGNGVPVSRFDGSGFITNWLVIGAFPKTEGWLEHDMLEKQGGEKDFILKPATEIEYTTADGTVKKAVTAPCNGPATNRMLSPRHLDKKLRNDYAYAYCLIRCDKDMMLRGMYGSSGEQKIWVNGEVVDARRYYRNIFQQAYNLFPLKLKKGLNRILVKMGTGRQGWPFYFGLTDLPPRPILSTPNDMLLPPSNRALAGSKGDPTNASIIWVYSPDPEREGMPFAHKEDRFDITPEFGYPGDALSFDGYRVFGVGREQSTNGQPARKGNRNKLAVFGKPSINSPLWFTDIADDVRNLKGVITAGNTVAVSFGGTYEKDDQKNTTGRLQLYSVQEGKLLNELEFGYVPQWDGMAAAYGKLFISTEDGKVICLE